TATMKKVMLTKSQHIRSVSTGGSELLLAKPPSAPVRVIAMPAQIGATTYIQRKSFQPVYEDIFKLLMRIPDKALTQRPAIKRETLETKAEPTNSPSPSSKATETPLAPNGKVPKKRGRKRNTCVPQVVKRSAAEMALQEREEKQLTPVVTKKRKQEVVDSRNARVNSFSKATPQRRNSNASDISINMDVLNVVGDYVENYINGSSKDRILRIMAHEFKKAHIMSEEGLLPIHDEILHGDVHGVKRQIFVCNHANLDINDLLSNAGEDCLQLALENDTDTEIVSMLLEANCLTNQLYDNSNTVLHLAAIMDIIDERQLGDAVYRRPLEAPNMNERENEKAFAKYYDRACERLELSKPKLKNRRHKQNVLNASEAKGGNPPLFYAVQGEQDMDPSLDNYKLSCELLGHSMDVRAVAVGGPTPDGGQMILSGSRDKSTKLWRPTGNEYLESVTLQDHKNFISYIYYLETEQWICTASNDATICIYKQDGFVPLLTLKGHGSTVCTLSEGLQARSLISGSWDKTAKGHEAAVWAVATLKEQLKYVTGGADKNIYYWNAKGEKLRLLKGHTDCVRGLIGLDANTLLSCGNDAVLREQVVVSCGEDSTLRMWNVITGDELGAPILHPAISVWSVACLKNGDIVTGCSDGVVRVFSQDPTRQASEGIRKAFDLAVATRNWELGNWNLVGDVTGASGGTQASSGKKLHEGKEYDFVFNVDISDTEPPIKLPYNRGEDPWQAAQTFIHRNNLPQAYLDQSAAVVVEQAPTGYQDPFTGGSRYVPGSSNTNVGSGGNVDPFTGASSYSTTASNVNVNFVRAGDKHFPVSSYRTFDTCDSKKFNSKLTPVDGKVGDEVLLAVIKLTEQTPELDLTSLEALIILLKWPAAMLFPVLDILRLAVRNEPVFSVLNNSHNFLGILTGSAASQLMVVRCLANSLSHATGRQQVESHLAEIIELVGGIKAGMRPRRRSVHVVTAGVVELLKWATDLEACYRSMQAIGNLTTTSCGQETVAQVVSVDYVMDKLRELTNTPQAENFSKVNSYIYGGAGAVAAVLPASEAPTFCSGIIVDLMSLFEVFRSSVAACCSCRVHSLLAPFRLRCAHSFSSSMANASSSSTKPRAKAALRILFSSL
ncbi:hypothetical protein M5D96_004931, partial [Drosophila gunungcola]